MARTFEKNKEKPIFGSKNGGAKIGNWDMKSVRIDASGREHEVRYANLNESQLKEQETDMIADALIRQAERGEFDVREYEDKDGNVIPNSKTGFARFIQDKAQTSRTASEGRSVPRGRVTEDGEPISISEDIKRHERKMSGRTGFSQYEKQIEAGQEGDDYKDDDRQDFETDRNDSSGTGPVGFGDGSHGTPEDQYPEARDKKMPYGGNMIGGGVKKSRFTRPDPTMKKKKELFKDETELEAEMVANDDDGIENLFKDEEKSDIYRKARKTTCNRCDGSGEQDGRRCNECGGSGMIKISGAGSTLEEGDRIDTITPLTSESPRTETIQEQTKTDILPQEPARIDVPGHGGGGKDMSDPLGDEEDNFEFNEDGSPSLPGESQSYPDKKVKYTEIEGMKKVKSVSGNVYIGKIVKVSHEAIIIDGVKLGDTKRNNYRVLRADVEYAIPYDVVAKPKQTTSSLSGLYDEVAGQDKKMSQVKIAEELKCVGCGEPEDLVGHLDSDKMCTNCRKEQKTANKDDDKFDEAFAKWVKKFREKGLSKDEAEEKAFEKVKHMASLSKMADSPILKKYFGMSGKAPKMDQEEAIARTEENIEGDGQLYGDDKGLKDQLEFHEKKVAKLKIKIAALVRSSETFEEQGNEKLAEECLKQAELITNEIKNSNVRVAQLKKESARPGKSKLFFDNDQNGDERMFE